MKYLKITAIVIFVTALVIINLAETFSTKCINASLATLVEMNTAHAELGIEDGYWEEVDAGSEEVCYSEEVFIQTAPGFYEDGEFFRPGYWTTIEVCYDEEVTELDCLPGGSYCIS